MVFLDRRSMDDYLFTALVDKGYAPNLKEVHAITDIVIDLLIDTKVLRDELTLEEFEAYEKELDDEDDDDEDER